MRFTDLELDLLNSLVNFAWSNANYSDNCGSIYFTDEPLYISRRILDNFTSIRDFQLACDLLMDKLARG